METHTINFRDKFARFSEHWSPKVVAQMNDYHFKLVKFQGEFVWHSHHDTDEAFIVIDGVMTIHFRDQDVVVRSGEMFVVPKPSNTRPQPRPNARRYSSNRPVQLILVMLVARRRHRPIS